MLIFVTYDGIQNSVFDGQVLAPIVKKLQHKEYTKALIISFEKKPIAHTYLKSKTKKHPHIEIITLKRSVFLGRLALILQLFRLKKILRTYTNYDLIARGPIAGWLCTKAANVCQCASLTIQARGLLAQELRYANQYTPSGIKKYLNKLRYYQLYNLEKAVYKHAYQLPNTHIQTVSNALKDYLISQFGADPSHITIATNDIPPRFEKNILSQWRKNIRQALNIPKHTKIYCYNGSVKPWQCPQHVIHYFHTLLRKQTQDIHLLILTQNTQAFATIIKKYNIPQSFYTVKTVKHSDIYKYLAACDYGMIFREPNIVNWVSRPTKVLEYYSVGLEVIHNNTVGFLTSSE